MEHEEQADRLEREADKMEREAERVGEEIDETRREWEAKKDDPEVPGADEPQTGNPGAAGSEESEES